MNTRDTLLAYSEWLDGEGVMTCDIDDPLERTHDELAGDFIDTWALKEFAQPLAGDDDSQANLGMATNFALISELYARAGYDNLAGEDWPQYRTVGS